MSKESALKLVGGQPIVMPAPNVPPAAATAPVTTTDATTTSESVPATTAQPTDDKLSIIIKKEAEIFKAREAMKKREIEIEAKKKEYDAVLERARQFEDTAKSDKIKALKMLGWTDTDIVNAMNQEPGTVNPVEEARRIAQEEAQKLRNELSEEKKKASVDRDNQLVTNFKGDIAKKLKDEASKFKFAAHEGKEAEIQAYHIVDQNLKLTGELMSIQEALEITNDLYKEKYDSARKLFEEVAPTVETTESATPARGTLAGKPPVSNTPAAKPRTITNAASATAASAANTSVRETPEQKRQRLADALRSGGLRK